MMVCKIFIWNLLAKLILVHHVVTCQSQKASASGAAVVSEYIGYLEKGQIPPKVISLRMFALV